MKSTHIRLGTEVFERIGRLLRPNEKMVEYLDQGGSRARASAARGGEEAEVMLHPCCVESFAGH